MWVREWVGGRQNVYFSFSFRFHYLHMRSRIHVYIICYVRVIYYSYVSKVWWATRLCVRAKLFILVIQLGHSQFHMLEHSIWRRVYTYKILIPIHLNKSTIAPRNMYSSILVPRSAGAGRMPITAVASIHARSLTISYTIRRFVMFVQGRIILDLFRVHTWYVGGGCKGIYKNMADALVCK